MNNQLVVKNASGADEVIQVIDIVTDSETGKQYLFYTSADSDEIYAAILKEADTAFMLEAITDEAEWELVEEILKNEIRVEGDSNE